MLPQRYLDEMELARGQQIGSWEVEEELGRGAMAIVYRVRHTTIGRRAALKVLARTDEPTAQRLLQEGIAQGSIVHPGIVSVIDHFRVDGRPALLLEWVDGKDLASLLAQGPLDRSRALVLFRQVAEALSAAHQAGLVHRDIKPSNILVSTEPDGQEIAKLGDFGLVKNTSADLTASNVVVGTPRYMAPEQMRSAQLVDRRADIFSLGALLYELCLGRPAFVGDDFVSLYAAKTSAALSSPDRLPPELSLEIRAAIAGCLQPQVSQRIPDCAALLSVLAGAPWSAPSDQTLDEDSAVGFCPSCGAPGTGELCVVCGAALTLSGRYRLIEPRPDAQTGRLWRAIDLRSGAIVAVRSPAPGADNKQRARFVRAAEILRQLSHPQIAKWIDGPLEEGGQLFVIREWIEGEPLQKGLRASESEAITLMLGICPALAYLAERSPPVIHGVIRAEHVLRASDGRIVLTLADEARSAGDGSLHDAPAEAPERWAGEATPASDLYGLAAFGIELLTQSPAHTLRQRRELPFAPLPHVRPQTQALLREMMSEDPGKRPSIAEVRERLAALSRPPLAQRAGSASERARSVVVVALAFFGLFGITTISGISFAYILLLLSPPVPPPPTAVALPEGPSPLRLLQAGPDLADRPVPGARCGEPFEVSITITSKTQGEIPLYVSDCKGHAQQLGSFRWGERRAVTLPGPSTLWTPLRRLACFGASPCSVQQPGEAVELLVDEQMLLGVALDDAGAPLIELLPARYDSWRLHGDRPSLDRPISLAREPWLPHASPAQARMGEPAPAGESVKIEGIYRRNYRKPDQIQILPEAARYTIAVVDEDGRPLEDAEVLCGSKDSVPSRGRTDEAGQIICDPGDGAPPWAVVQAAGRVAATTDLVLPVVRVVLREAREVAVGCAGLPGDRCSILETPPVCAGSAGRESGICRLSGNIDPVVTCSCAMDADRLVHGVLGTVPLGKGETQAWYDLRGISGRVEGRLDGSILDGCVLTLQTHNGALRTVTSKGYFLFQAVPEGSYRIDGCGIEPRILSVGAGVTELTLPSKLERSPILRSLPKPRPEPSEERPLLAYTFPAWPEGAVGPLSSCSVEVTLSAEGRATETRVLRCPSPFAEAAAEILEQWRWAEAPQESTEEIIVPFDPERKRPEAH